MKNRSIIFGAIAAFVVVSLSFSAQAAEKKKISGTNKHGPWISKTVVPLGPAFKTTFKEDGSRETTTWEGTYKATGGTGKFKNIKGGGTYRGKATAEGASEDWEGEMEY